MKDKNRDVKWNIRKPFAALIWLVIWELASFFVGSSLLLPGPHETLLALIRLMGTKIFYADVLWTMFRCVLGMALAFAFGVFFAILAARSDKIKDFLEIPMTIFKSVPVMALIIYIILIITSEFVAVVVCVLMCLPIVYTNILNGLESIDKKTVEMGMMFKLDRWQMLRLIYIPSIYSELKTAISLTFGMSWKVVIAAEVLSIPDFSIGYRMLNSKYYLRTDELFAYIVTVILLSVVLGNLVRKIPLKAKKVGKIREKIQDPSVGGAAAVSFKCVEKSFEGSKIINELSFKFEPGITVVCGPSGSGKTTIARLISGLEKADRGEILYEGNCETAYLFQEDRLLPWLNVYENIKIGLIPSGITDEKAIGERIKETAELFEISDALDKMPEELSGGMAHRAAFARTVINDLCRVMIFDEPSRGLDEELKERIKMKLMLKNGEWGKERKGAERTIVLITHDPDDLKIEGAKVLQLKMSDK